MLQLGLSQLILANFIAKLSAGLFAFFAHRWFTFRVAEIPTIRQQGIYYFLLLMLNIALSSALLTGLLVWMTELVVAKFIVDIICVVFSYGVSKHFIFLGKFEYSDQKQLTGVDV